ncbi:hypothetical protein OROGR_028982 [Orobanche gracilis]
MLAASPARPCEIAGCDRTCQGYDQFDPYRDPTLEVSRVCIPQGSKALG